METVSLYSSEFLCLLYQHAGYSTELVEVDLFK
jgi:hypothetical protein